VDNTTSRKKSPRVLAINEASDLDMASAAADQTWGETVDRDQYLDHAIDLVELVRTARERAQRQVDAFKNLAEYEIRKIYGQRTEIQYSKTSARRELFARKRKQADGVVSDVSPQQAPSFKEDRRQTSLSFDAQQNMEEP
jgi:hypothetical protein